MLLTQAQLASALGVGKMTIYNWQKKGLPFTKTRNCSKNNYFDFELSIKWLSENVNHKYAVFLNKKPRLKLNGTDSAAYLGISYAVFRKLAHGIPREKVGKVFRYDTKVLDDFKQAYNK